MRPSPDASTLDEPTLHPAPDGPAEGLRVSIVWHRDPGRIGATCWTPWGVAAAARALRVSEHGLRIRMTELELGE